MIHRDIKPSNIIIDEKTLQLKLIDFGLAISIDKDNEDKRCGTILYQSPEQLIEKKQYNQAVDIWACGIVLYQLLTLGEHPIYNENENTKKRTKDGY